MTICASELDLGGALADGHGAYATCTYRYLDNDEDFTVHVVRLEQTQPDVLAPAIEELALPMPDYEAEGAPGVPARRRRGPRDDR